MYDSQLNNLRTTIEWAQRDQDLQIFRMAGVQLNQLESYLAHLSELEQRRAQNAINKMLPMEWPLWMEACRYDDVFVQSQPVTIH